MVVYDVTSPDSFENVKSWLQEVNRYAAENVTVMLVGNKTDAEGERKVTTAQGQQLADEEGIAFAETSAKTAANVDKAFDDMTREIVGKMASSQARQTGININRPTKASKKRCYI
eukprot:TRINITY_DN878_c0_g1_i3.p3 TRINITY_DN878_c0_g1~~TRINITY_DN878_c0_g1_i3.p3  ORF type:complete len:115 (-),score=42.79 TRINITY_DN878_c0_g1_i3:32-376(-)